MASYVIKRGSRGRRNTLPVVNRLRGDDAEESKASLGERWRRCGGWVI